jgi:pimeloyl-ACP methyl ester carboxylesterase
MPESVEGNVIAVVYQTEALPEKASEYVGIRRTVVSYRIVDPTVKLFVMFLEPGNYEFVLVHDKNGNLMVDADEPVYLHDHGNRLGFSDVVKRINLSLTVPESGRLPSGYPRDLDTLPESVVNSYFLAFGETLNIGDERFSLEAGRLGLWEPARFLEKYGAGMYWLEPYDPERIPVIFVSGAGGSAREWQYFFDRLDREKFQVWYWLYPSGMRISYLGHNLNRWIDRMSMLYGFERVYIVAHSMGGLVARDAIVNHLKEVGASEDKRVMIRDFISISTPWNGHRMARKGVEKISRPVPSWYDITPGSKFLQTVFNVSLKGRVNHHLLFGYTRRGGDDGAVSLSSVLLDEAQRDAVEVHGYRAEHVEILFKNAVFEHVQEILYNAEEQIQWLREHPAKCHDVKTSFDAQSAITDNDTESDTGAEIFPTDTDENSDTAMKTEVPDSFRGAESDVNTSRDSDSIGDVGDGAN